MENLVKDLILEMWANGAVVSGFVIQNEGSAFIKNSSFQST